MSKLKHILVLLGLIASLGLAVSPTASAFDPWADTCKDAKDTAICKDKDKNQVAPFIKTLVNTLLYVLAAVSVIVIIFAGIFYTTSVGDQAMITKAKNTLMYAVIGLVVAIMAYAIVNFVLDRFVK